MVKEQTDLIAASVATLRVIPFLTQLTERATREAACLSPSQAGMLFMLTESPLRGIEIAKRWGVSRAAVTEAAQRLESSRMIKRKRDPRDQRAWLFELTPKGHRALEEFGRVSTEAVARYVGELTGQQQRALAEANDALFNVFSEKFE